MLDDLDKKIEIPAHILSRMESLVYEFYVILKDIKELNNNPRIEKADSLYVPRGKKIANDVARQFSEKSQWIPYGIVPIHADEFNPKKQLSFLENYASKIRDIFKYKNIEGDLLGYVIQVISANGEEKMLPCTFVYKTRTKNSCWRIMGFWDGNFKPLYGAEKLAQPGSKDKPILVVESEKYVKPASKMFPEFVVLSWLGGIGFEKMRNWSLLKGRKVIVWYLCEVNSRRSSETIKNLLNHVNGNEDFVRIVDTSDLGLNKGWKFGDPIQDIQKEKKIKTILQELLGVE